MSSIFLVIRYEIRTALSKRSFWLTTIALPLFIILVSVLPQIVAGDAFDPDPVQTASNAQVTTGFVDLSGIIHDLPADISPESLRAFADENAANQAMDSGAIAQYFLIDADYLSNGKVDLITSQFNVFGGFNQAEVLEYVLNANLLGDAAMARLVRDPTPRLQLTTIAPEDPREADGVLRFALPFAAMFILFFIISFTSGYMLQSVAREKENRTAEVLLLSLRPRNLMVGKLAGLGIVALLQMAFWMGGALLVANRGSAVMPIPIDYRPPADFLILTVVYLFLGYLAFASAMGALGALAPSAREGAQYTFIIILPLLLPFWLNSAFVANPNSGIALALSLIPITAPTAMVARLAVTAVPAWQIIVSLAGLVATTYFFVSLSARFFRADTLLSSSSLSWRRIVREIRGVSA
ncbi:MAG: ABC transporter permease [Caldilineales bacterium]|nr:ABC transporter permease [Caldilineales bacterium]